MTIERELILRKLGLKTEIYNGNITFGPETLYVITQRDNKYVIALRKLLKEKDSTKNEAPFGYSDDNSDGVIINRNGEKIGTI